MKKIRNLDRYRFAYFPLVHAVLRSLWVFLFFSECNMFPHCDRNRSLGFAFCECVILIFCLCCIESWKYLDFIFYRFSLLLILIQNKHNVIWLSKIHDNHFLISIIFVHIARITLTCSVTNNVSCNITTNLICLLFQLIMSNLDISNLLLKSTSIPKKLSPKNGGGPAYYYYY